MADTLAVSPASSVTDARARSRRHRGCAASFAVLACVVVALVALLVVELVRGPAHSSHAVAEHRARIRAARRTRRASATPLCRRRSTRGRRCSATTTAIWTRTWPRPAPRRPARSPRSTRPAERAGGEAAGDEVQGRRGGQGARGDRRRQQQPQAIKVMLFLDQTVKNTQLAAPAAGRQPRRPDDGPGRQGLEGRRRQRHLSGPVVWGQLSRRAPFWRRGVSTRRAGT